MCGYLVRYSTVTPTRRAFAPGCSVKRGIDGLGNVRIEVGANEEFGGGSHKTGPERSVQVIAARWARLLAQFRTARI